MISSAVAVPEMNTTVIAIRSPVGGPLRVTHTPTKPASSFTVYEESTKLRLKGAVGSGVSYKSYTTYNSVTHIIEH